MNVSRIYRLLRLIALLQSGESYTAAKLADKLEISKRTLFRDLNSLEMANVPYYFDEDTASYKIGEHFFLPPVNLTLEEALALLVLTGRLKNETQVPMLTQGKKAATKIEGILPESIRSHIGSVINSLSFHLPPLANHDGIDSVFNKLSEAIVDQTTCRIKYDSFYDGKIVHLTVNPLRLVFMHRAWYLLGWSLKEKALRTYKLIRMKNVTLQDRKFTEQHEEALDNHFGNAWAMIPEGETHQIQLHFDPKVAGNVAEVQWHKSQKVVWNYDRSIEYHVEVDGLNEISWWILGYGDQVTVVKPQALADKIVAVARNVIERHGA